MERIRTSKRNQSDSLNIRSKTREFFNEISSKQAFAAISVYVHYRAVRVAPVHWAESGHSLHVHITSVILAKAAIQLWGRADPGIYQTSSDMFRCYSFAWFAKLIHRDRFIRKAGRVSKILTTRSWQAEKIRRILITPPAQTFAEM